MKTLFGICKKDDDTHIKKLENNFVQVLCEIDCHVPMEDFGFYSQIDLAQVSCKKCDLMKNLGA